jgi:hypothetical protein
MIEPLHIATVGDFRRIHLKSPTAITSGEFT